MTITYSLDVANTRFCGFVKLLGRWKGSIYKILWKEFIVFVLGYASLSLLYRFALKEHQKRIFENVVIYFETFIDLIPLSFVLGFYVSLIIGRWWKHFNVIQWPDKLCFMIAAYVHGADDRSRMIRRTLARYLILTQALTFQAVSTAVKKRFPTTQHLVSAGLMTKEERTIYEKLVVPYSKWWLPAQWFGALAMRARKEGRIKDSVLLDGIFREFILYRNACADMFNMDWISVPLVYTQVVTLATYTYSLALMVGRQYLDPDQGYPQHKVDLYFPMFTMLQFFFYMGWLKVAEQIVNPYGEDDDDFELNWCMDRNCQVVYLIVDHFHTKHPKLHKDVFWDEMEPRLPQTKITAKTAQNPQLGSAFNMEVDPADAEFLPMDTLLEEDDETYAYSSDSVKQARTIRCRPSFLMNILNSNFTQNMRRRSSNKPENFIGTNHLKPPYTVNMDRLAFQRTKTVVDDPKPSIKKAGLTNYRSSSISFAPSTTNRPKNLFYDTQQANRGFENSVISECDGIGIANAITVSVSPVAANFEESPEACNGNPHQVMEDENGISLQESYMPSIPEEPSRLVPMIPEASDDGHSTKMNDVQNLVAEASKVLEELNRVVVSCGSKTNSELRGYDSCCSLINEGSTSGEDMCVNEVTDEDSVVVDMNRDNAMNVERSHI